MTIQISSSQSISPWPTGRSQGWIRCTLSLSPLQADLKGGSGAVSLDQSFCGSMIIHDIYMFARYFVHSSLISICPGRPN